MTSINLIRQKITEWCLQRLKEKLPVSNCVSSKTAHNMQETQRLVKQNKTEQLHACTPALSPVLSTLCLVNTWSMGDFSSSSKAFCFSLKVIFLRKTGEITTLLGMGTHSLSLLCMLESVRTHGEVTPSWGREMCCIKQIFKIFFG